MKRRLLRAGMSLGLGLATLVGTALLLAPACACLPIVYHAVSVSDVPQAYLVTFQELSHGLDPVKAWRYEIANGRKPVFRGFLIRGNLNWWTRRDFRVSEHAAENREPMELAPVSSP